MRSVAQAMWSRSLAPGRLRRALGAHRHYATAAASTAAESASGRVRRGAFDETLHEYADVGFGLDADTAARMDDAEEILEGTNHIEKKKGHYRLRHTLGHMLDYMQSKTYAATYQGAPVRLWYRRNAPGPPAFWPKPKLMCVWPDWRYKVNNPCPICRDEYLWFDFRNVELMKQFLVEGTCRPLPLDKSALCQEQYNRLNAELIRAFDTGYLHYPVPHRVYKYSEYYGERAWPEADDAGDVPNYMLQPHRPRASPFVIYPEHNPDLGRRQKDWNKPWWHRWDTFAKKSPQ